MFERLKETWRALRSRRKLQNLKEFKCVTCDPDLWKNIKMEPGCVVPVCREHFQAGTFYGLKVDKEEAEVVETQNLLRRKILQENLHLIQERVHQRMLNMEPVKVIVSPLDHDLRKLLWEIRYHLEARDPVQPYRHLKEGRALGQRLEEALKEQDLPSSPPTKEFCAMCLGATREQARESGLRICSTHQKPEEETRE